MAPPKTICITGANQGVGFECARQLALRKDVEKVILACRNQERAEEAKAALEKSTGRTCFDILRVDVSDPGSVKNAVDSLSSSESIDCLILNAGGFAGSNPTELTENGTMKIFDLNVLGSVYMTDLLLEQNKITREGGQVLYISSETARGIRLNTRHKFVQDGSLEEMKSLCDGSCFKKPPRDMDVYGRVKLIGTLWAGSMARQHPEMRFVTVSPGNTTGTNVVNHMRLPAFIRCIANNVALHVMVWFRKFHTLKVGAKRYLDVIYDEETYKAGHFYASKTSWPTGPMADQIDHWDILYKESYQDNANAAVHAFLNNK